MDHSPDFAQHGNLNTAHRVFTPPGTLGSGANAFRNGDIGSGSGTSSGDMADSTVAMGKETNTFRLFDTFYFFVTTVTTTGYGDIYPKTDTVRVLGF
jgi:hypothetical protein